MALPPMSSFIKPITFFFPTSNGIFLLLLSQFDVPKQFSNSLEIWHKTLTSFYHISVSYNHNKTHILTIYQDVKLIHWQILANSFFFCSFLNFKCRRKSGIHLPPLKFDEEANLFLVFSLATSRIYMFSIILNCFIIYWIVLILILIFLQITYCN